MNKYGLRQFGKSVDSFEDLVVELALVVMVIWFTVHVVLVHFSYLRLLEPKVNGLKLRDDNVLGRRGRLWFVEDPVDRTRCSQRLDLLLGS